MLGCTGFGLMLLAVVVQGQPPATTEPDVLDLSQQDIVLLADTARAAMESALNGRSAARPPYKPMTLRERKARLRMTARWSGRIVAETETGRGELLEVAVEGGAALGGALRESKNATNDQPERLGLEIEVFGPPEYLTAGLTKDNHWSPELYASFEPGIHAVGAELDRRRGWATPSVILASGFTPDLALEFAEQRLGLTAAERRERVAELRYFRFRTVHIWQPDARERPVRLRRGVLVVPHDAVTAAKLDATLDDLAGYMRYRRNRDGAFAYRYIPTTDRYDDRNNATAQMAALAALLDYARVRGDHNAVETAAPLLRATLHNLKPLPDAEDALYVEFTGQQDKLGTTAAYLLALIAASHLANERDVKAFALPPDIDATMERLANALLATQREDGGIGVADDPDAGGGTSADYAAGLALLALARLDTEHSRPRIESAIRSAARYYRAAPADSRDNAAAAIHARALAAAYRRLRDPQIGEPAFRLLERFTAAQVADPDGRRPELAGAIDLSAGRRLGIETADVLAALADGIELARWVGDERRAARYTEAARAAARFVLQLRFRKEECYYIRNTQDVLGAFRTSPWDASVPIDTCHRALTGLARAREALFGRWSDTQRGN
jgi:hypothetical protein